LIRLLTVDQCDPVGADCYQFRLTGIGANVDVTSAHLWLYKTRDVIGHHFPDTFVGGQNQTITVWLSVATRRRTDEERDGDRLGRNDGARRSSGRRRILASVSVRRRSGCWLRVNILRAIHDYIERSRGQHGGLREVRLAAECRGGCVLARGRQTAVGGSDRRPVLVVGTVENRRGRRRRTLNSSCPASRCCLHTLYIDFARIGWNFVISPHGYDFNYCHGPCNCKSSSLNNSV